MAGPSKWPAFFGSSPGAGIRLVCRARFPEQGQPSKHRAGSRHGFAKVVSSGRSIVRKSLVLIEAGRIVVELPTGDRVERIGRLPGLIQRFVFPADCCLRRLSHATHWKERSEDRRSGEFRRELCVDVAEVAKAFPREAAQVERLGFDAPFRRLWEYYLCYCEAGFRSGMIDVGLYSIQHRRA